VDIPAQAQAAKVAAARADAAQQVLVVLQTPAAVAVDLEPLLVAQAVQVLLLFAI
jgi:hypothetical protein